MLIYDIEIKKAILGKGEIPFKGIEYCDGWHDHANMGISCICVYDYKQGRYRVFVDDNMDGFITLVANRKIIVGFNNVGFDNKVITSNIELTLGYLNSKSYDILREVWISQGYDPDNFKKETHDGYGLDVLAKANFPDTGGKTGHGALAPVDYQKGSWGSLIDYCLADIWLTKKLFDLIILTGQLSCPKTNEAMRIRKPY